MKKVTLDANYLNQTINAMLTMMVTACDGRHDKDENDVRGSFMQACVANFVGQFLKGFSDPIIPNSYEINCNEFRKTLEEIFKANEPKKIIGRNLN